MSYRVLFCKFNSITEDGIEKAFRDMGIPYDLMSEEYTSIDYDTDYLQKLADRVSDTEYTFIFSINFRPIIARFCHAIGKIYISWTIDVPVFALYSETVRYPENRIFCFDHSQYLRFRDQNPGHVFYLPLGYHGVAEHRRGKYDCDVSFVGSTYKEKCRYNGIEDKLSEYNKGFAQGVINAQLNVYGYNLIEDCLTDEFCDSFKNEVSWPALGADYTEDVKGIIADTYIGEKCTELERYILIKRVSEHFSMDLYTQSDVTPFPKVHFKGAADSKWMMPYIFEDSKININTTSKPIRTGLPQRIFDICGCGGFCITNYQAELPEMFEIGRDLVAYESMDDLLAKIEYYLSHEDERLEIANNGRNKVISEHTYEKRIMTMLRVVLEN